MSSLIRKVAVVGPTGGLGQLVIDQLLKSDFEVTAITRDAQKAKGSLNAASHMDIVQGDYTSAESLATSLKGHDAVVSLILRGQPDPQILVIEATILAKVPHIITSSFGIDLRQEYLRQLPPFQGKLQMGDHVAQKAKEGLITFTSIQTGIFFGSGLSMGMMINLKDDGVPSVQYDEGETKFSVSAEEDIARAVAGTLRKKNELPVNCSLFIHTSAVSQNQLRQYAKELRPGREFPVTRVDTAEGEKKAWEAYNSGERDVSKLAGFMSRGTFGLGLGLFKHLDNELLGIEERDELRTRNISRIQPEEAIKISFLIEHEYVQKDRLYIRSYHSSSVEFAGHCPSMPINPLFQSTSCSLL